MTLNMLLLSMLFLNLCKKEFESKYCIYPKYLVRQKQMMLKMGTRKTLKGIMDVFFKKVNQKVNLGLSPPHTSCLPGHLDIAILKDRFFKNLSKKAFKQCVNSKDPDKRVHPCSVIRTFSIYRHILQYSLIL